MTDDAQLLRRYAQTRSEEAFAELVRRHLGWVYRVSLRRTGGRADLAQEVAQNVFTVLARKAEALSSRDVLAGWLYTTARYAARQILRTEGRRKFHEQEAAHMTLPHDNEEASEWQHLRPALIQELDRLPEREREALLLRFFEGKSFAEVGARLQIGEDAARKRVERGLERLGARLARVGAKSTAAAALLLASESVASVPASLHAAVTQAALAGAAPGAATAGVLQLMSATKTTWGAAALLGLAGIIGLGTATVAFYEIQQDRARKAALAGLESAYRSDEEAYRAVQRKAAEAERAAAAATAKVAAARAKAKAQAEAARAASPMGPDGRPFDRAKARSDGVAFLAAYPQARAMLMEIGKYQIARNQGLFFRQAGLTAEQIDAFETATAQHWIDTLEMAPNSIHPGETRLADDQVAAILGEGVLPAYDASKRAQPAENWVGPIAAAAAEGGAPLSLPQVTALEQTVLDNSPEYTAGQNVKPANVNWQNVLAQAQQTLTPAQWQQVQTAVQWQKVTVQAMALGQAQQATGTK